MVTPLDIFNMTFFNNTLLAYLIFFGILAASVILGKIAYYVTKNFVKLLTKKTETMLDDMLIDVAEHPVIFLIFIFGFYIAYKTLTLSAEIEQTLFNIVLVLFIINLTWFFTRLLDGVINYYLIPLSKKTGTDLDDAILPILQKIGKVILVFIAAIIILDKFGYNVTSLIAGLGIGGLAVALAAQETLSNMFGGITILVDKPFSLGNRVRIGGNDGHIKEIGIRSTKMTTLDGSELIIPNSTIAKEIIENVAREKSRRIKMILGLEYNTPSKKLENAIKIIQEIIKKHSHTEEESKVFFEQFADSSLNIMVIYWIKNLEMIPETQSEINFEIKRRFEKEGLSFAFPSRTLYLKKS